MPYYHQSLGLAALVGPQAAAKCGHRLQCWGCHRAQKRIDLLSIHLPIYPPTHLADPHAGPTLIQLSARHRAKLMWACLQSHQGDPARNESAVVVWAVIRHRAPEKDAQLRPMRLKDKQERCPKQRATKG